MFEAFLNDTSVNLCTHFDIDKVRSPVDNLIDAYYICKYMYEQILITKS